MLKRKKARRFRVLCKSQQWLQMGLYRRLAVQYQRYRGMFVSAAGLSLEEDAFKLFTCGIKTVIADRGGMSPEHAYAVELKILCENVIMGAIERFTKTEGWLSDPYMVTEQWRDRGFIAGNHMIVGVLACLWEPTVKEAIVATAHRMRVTTMDLVTVRTAQGLVYCLWRLVRCGLVGWEVYREIIADSRVLGGLTEVSPGSYSPRYLLWVALRTIELIWAKKILLLDDVPDVVESLIMGSHMAKSAQCLIVGMVSGAIIGCDGVMLPYEHNLELFKRIMCSEY